MLLANVLLSGCQSDEVMIETPNGMINGLRFGEVDAFRGIPYARPPIGDFRWRSPEPVQPWQSALDATAFGPACWQDNSDGNTVFLNTMLSRSGMPGYGRWLVNQFAGFAETEISEDCLTLNVLVPRDKPPEDTPLPVMFWIHGGGHQYGSGGGMYESQSLATKGVILVSINYRLGLYGFLAHRDLAAEDPNGSTGNYGMLDQIAALQWVQAQISSFGGDPDNVTIFGESAGGHSVGQLMASPLATGLFHRAIAQSGTGFQQFQAIDSSMENISGFEAGDRLAQMIGVSGKEEIQALRGMSTDELAAAAVSPLLTSTFHPQIDGYALPQPTALAFAQGKQARVPLMVGSNADEGSVLYMFGMNPIDGGSLERPQSVDAWQQMLERDFGDQAADVSSHFAVDDDGDVIEIAAKLMGDSWFGRHAYYMAERHADASPNTYLYFFERTPPAPEQTIGAGHAQELFSVFKNRVPFWPTDARDDELDEEMQGYWARFAQSGNPNNEELPDWPVFDSVSRQEMAFANDRSFARPVERQARYEAMKGQQSRRELKALEILQETKLEGFADDPT
jgi:para-nitrobenzyl esterase